MNFKLERNQQLLFYNLLKSVLINDKFISVNLIYDFNNILMIFKLAEELCNNYNILSNDVIIICNEVINYMKYMKILKYSDFKPNISLTTKQKLSKNYKFIVTDGNYDLNLSYEFLICNNSKGIAFPIKLNINSYNEIRVILIKNNITIDELKLFNTLTDNQVLFNNKLYDMFLEIKNNDDIQVYNELKNNENDEQINTIINKYFK